MKTLLTTLIVSLLTLNVFAVNPLDGLKSDEASKLAAIVKKADKNDWKTYMKAAQLSINWDTDLEMAKEWIDHAHSISVNPHTLEVMGDYYLKVGNVEKAYATYQEALLIDITKVDMKTKARLQRKLMVYAQELK